mgnify:CR=1 FL=1
MRFRIPATLIAAALGIGLAASASAQGLIESPLLEEAVKSGELPPIQERIPDEPLIVSFAGTDGAPGIHGGDINMLIPRERYLRHMVVYSYARLVGYNEEYELAVTAGQAMSAASPDVDLASMTIASVEVYQAMIDAFADNVAQKLK